MTFSSMDELKKHSMLYHDFKAEVVESIACKFPGCAKQFETLKSHCIHKTIAHGCPAWSCDFCDKHFPNETSLCNHVRSHKKSVSGLPPPEKNRKSN